MGKIFGISKLPVSNSFPSVKFGETKFIDVCAGLSYNTFSKTASDTFVQKTPQNTLKSFISKFFRCKHTKA